MAGVPVSAAMTGYRIPLAGRFDGKDEYTCAGSAVLHGIGIRELVEAMSWDTSTVDNQPLDMKQLGRRRWREAQAHTGSSHPADVLVFWAMKRWGDRVTIVHDVSALMVWLTTEDLGVVRELVGDDPEPFREATKR